MLSVRLLAIMVCIKHFLLSLSKLQISAEKTHKNQKKPEALCDWGRRLAESSPDISVTVTFGKLRLPQCLKTLAALATLLKLEK